MKKIFAIVLAVLMVTCAFAGCANQEAAETTAAAAETNAAAAFFWAQTKYDH